MNTAEVKSRLWSNTLSNYTRTAVATVVGLATFRLLYQSLGSEEFGFWALLWSVFGYGVLLDFGFGFAAQKRVAELSVSRDWQEMSRVLSSILGFYSLVALLIAGGALALSPWIIRCLDVSPANAPAFRVVLAIFFAGVGLAFPMGLFPEILRGQQRIRLANHLTSAALVARLVLIAVAVRWNWGFPSIMVIALVLSLAPDVLAAFFALRSLPGVSIHPRHFCWRSMRQTASFSVFAYLNTATNLVLGKADQLVIGTTLGVGAVAIYQAGARVADVFAQFTRQLQDALSPAAAHLHASADPAALRGLVLQALRWSVLLATPLYLLCAFHMSGLLQLLTGSNSLPPAMWWTGQVLLAWFFSTILTHSVSKRVFMMTGHHRRLLKLGTAEAVANLGLSLGLVLATRNVTAVAVGSLIPAFYFGWCHLWPWLASECGTTKAGLFRQAAWPVLVASLPMLALLVALAWWSPARSLAPWLRMLACGGAAGLLGAACLLRFALDAGERSFLLSRLPRPRRTAPSLATGSSPAVP